MIAADAPGIIPQLSLSQDPAKSMQQTTFLTGSSLIWRFRLCWCDIIASDIRRGTAPRPMDYPQKLTYLDRIVDNDKPNDRNHGVLGT